MNGTDPMQSYAIIPATHNSTTHGPMDGVWVISHDPKRGFTHQQTNTDMVIEFTTLIMTCLWFSWFWSFLLLLFLYDDDLTYIYIYKLYKLYIYIYTHLSWLKFLLSSLSWCIPTFRGSICSTLPPMGVRMIFIRSGLARSSRRGWPRGGDDIYWKWPFK